MMIFVTGKDSRSAKIMNLALKTRSFVSKNTETRKCVSKSQKTRNLVLKMMNSAATQMFINFSDNTNLDGMDFSPFAKVISGATNKKGGLTC